jgi:RNA polymerase sigma-70 factor (ECF subfamily)
MKKADLLERLRRGDDALLKEIYDSYKPDFIHWAMRLGIDSYIAEDIFQVSVVILYDNAVTGKLNRLSSTLKTYLFSIGKHKCLEHKRGQKNDFLRIEPHMLELLVETETPENEILNDVDQLAKALTILGDPCKQLLEFMYYQKLNQDSISEIMGYKDRDTVKSKKYKCIARLKKILENPEEYETDISGTD